MNFLIKDYNQKLKTTFSGYYINIVKNYQDNRTFENHMEGLDENGI